MPRASTRRLALASAVALALLGLGPTACLLPREGTPVFVDGRAGDFWSGKGMLVEVSEDRLRCRVAVRDRALFVHDRWVACASVHPRRAW